MAFGTSCRQLDFCHFFPLLFRWEHTKLSRLGNGDCTSLHRFPDGLSSIEEGERCSNGLNAAAKQHRNIVLIEPTVERV
ncbi:hypothetical protein KPRYC492_27115 [Klebsiella pneumoniae RYC492]|nr:hypothetical protein KPRYC492_27115 [Klebsiella pneumoniae RYC492]